MNTASHRAAPACRRNRPFRRLLNWLLRRPLLIGVTIIAVITVTASAYQNAQGRASSTPQQATPTASDCADSRCSAGDGSPPEENMGDPALDPSNDCEEGGCPQPGSETGPKAETRSPSAAADPAPAPAPETSLIGTGPRTWPLVKSGSQGCTVAAVQLLLTAHGYRTDTDAAFGPRTTAQVRSFQRDNSLHDDGIVGPDTWHTLITNLRSGDRGPAVTAVQRLLAVHGHPVDNDGTFGTSTAQAVRAFQEERHLAADSVVGPDTWAALLSQA
ncbi:peptidoglycan-binding protein [Streptomyces sp. NPDC090023]|uniref:peptidoglycan-binding domain-containing protein n=1 Tax=unclassified Streptomyces TaxID=2593676 RepID=UPI003809A1A2